MNPLVRLSRRERQIMDALFRLGKASALEVRNAIPEPPSYTAVRTMLRILEDKKAITHEEEAGKYFYTAVVPRNAARASAMRDLLDTFFAGSAGRAAAALLGSSKKKLTPQELDRLAQFVEKARKESSND